jgi:metal-responsive CopG/Arc/MetJ family transcriptional regulator
MAKVLLSIDDELLARVDETARKRKLTRSAFVSETMRREVSISQKERQAKFDRAIQSLNELARKYGTGHGSMAEQIRLERDSRR